MKRITKPKTDHAILAAAGKSSLAASSRNKENGHASRPLPLRVVRTFVAIIFAFIVFAVGALHFHLWKLESSSNSIDNGTSGRDESVMGVHGVLRRREIHKQILTRREVPSAQTVQKVHAPLSPNESSSANDDNHPIPGRGTGSKRGHIACDAITPNNDDISPLISYWNDPRTDQDNAFQSPFAITSLDPPIPTTTKRYLSFEPDCGGWNNIRMEFEIMIVFAAVTGRTLILPPDYPVYLLQKDTGSRHRGLQDFFQYGGDRLSQSHARGGGGFDDVVDVVTMRDFFREEIIEKKSYPLPVDETNRTKVLSSIEKCNYKAKDERSCIHLFDHMATVADFVPSWHGEQNCLIMDDVNWYEDSSIAGLREQDASQHEHVVEFCNGRSPVYYNRHIHEAPLIHFRSHLKETRLLVHFYAFIYFTSPKIGNYYKRLVRDRVRYSDAIFCAAGKVVKALLDEFGSYSSMHCRRGDFQWPRMRISAEEWLANTRHIFHEGEVLYISTDETDRTFFEPLARRYHLKFLSDYKELAGLDRLDPNFAGMIDQVIASRGREFVGTYFSSFSAFIGRMRGYHGMSGRTMHYGHIKHMNETHSWVNPHSSYSAREFPTGWVAIDGETEPTEKNFF
ncbi:hypothetical protein HJC23_010698 [Cyclotella cryptica]|uniref:O-fucosyltransferase family protein n=1 Tax=Cyclotella cryptica TaxID=29204 RepID=A0ABD3NGU3_9STRA|eukprot:CCRYP_020975-RA/>CCRYP_020975-RA protein AED:0.03 eAED:-0.03 QI:0/-1/0/1/-1/1/1/0/622